ncbi:MAG TPA: DUF2911 domain-containing protein [Gemmatimonadaceae bacterium]|nr:DUF2911 domain-containing protein [Gemmatimonadaceae bacterium]
MNRLPSALAALLLAAGSLAAQGRQEPGAFVVLLGRDTIAVERFSSTKDGINLEQVLRSPQATLRHSHLGVTPAGELTGIHVMVHPIGGAPDAPLIASTKLTLAGDSATIQAVRGDSTMPPQKAAARKDMIPAVSMSFLPYEMATMRFRAQKGDSLAVTFINAAGQQLPVTVKRIGADSVSLVNPFYRFHARIDRQGRILALAGEPGTPFQATVRRVPSVDIEGIAKTWQANDKQAHAMGQLSPADSVRAAIGGATIAIDYSRPAKRGRAVFGGIVPWGQVWRTGANAATTFTTSRDVEIGGTLVPAGSYTLFTIPTQQGTTLIVSKRTKGENGQPLWGTEYQDDMDLARIPMSTTTLAAPVEQFEIAVEPRDAGGMLRMRWDTREMSVPIVVR